MERVVCFLVNLNFLNMKESRVAYSKKQSTIYLQIGNNLKKIKVNFVCCSIIKV